MLRTRVHLPAQSGLIEQANDGQGGPTGEQFNYLGLVLRTTYARQITERLKLGGTFKLIRESTGKDLSMSSYGFDIGSNFNTGLYGFILGMSVTNLGPEVKFGGKGLEVVDEEEPSEILVTQTDSFPLSSIFLISFPKLSLFCKCSFNKLLKLKIEEFNAEDNVFPILSCESPQSRNKIFDFRIF